MYVVLSQDVERIGWESGSDKEMKQSYLSNVVELRLVCTELFLMS